MTQKKNSRRWKVVIIVIMVFIIALLSINLFATWFVKNKLEGSAFFNQPGGYQLHFEKLRVNVFTGTASGANIHLSPTPSFTSESPQKADFTAKAMKFSGIGLYSLLFKRVICINEIRVEKPVITIENIRSEQSKSFSKKPFSLYDIIHPKFDNLRISRLAVNKGTIKIAGRDSSDFFLAADSFSFEVTNLIADSSTARNGKIFRIGNASVSFENIHGNFTKGLYRIAIPSLTMNTRDSTMIIDSLLLSPTVDKRQFAKKLGRQVSCMTIMLANVRVHSGEFQQFIEHRDVLIDTVEIGYAKIHKYRDKNIPRKFVFHSLHHTFLDSLHFKINLDAVKLDDADVVYEILNPGETEPGMIAINNLKAELSGFSNTTMNDTMKVDVNCSMMSQASLEINMLLPLSKDEFYTTGMMGPYNMQIWNSMLKNYSPPMQIKSGHAESMKFSCYANEKEGTGQLTFIYSDLTVRILNKNKEPGSIKTPVKTFVANKLIIVKDNPDKNTLRIGKIEFTRDPGRNIISYVWHLIFSGMKSSVGLQEEKMKKEIPASNSEK